MPSRRLHRRFALARIALAIAARIVQAADLGPPPCVPSPSEPLTSVSFAFPRLLTLDSRFPISSSPPSLLFAFQSLPLPISELVPSPQFLHPRSSHPVFSRPLHHSIPLRSDLTTRLVSLSALEPPTAEMYYEYSDPCTGRVTMPLPSSEYAPYYSGRQGTFETFLQEYESLADRCMLSGPQRVGTIVPYMAPSVREVLKSVNGPCSHDWSDYRQFLVYIFGTPRHLVARQKLLNFVQDSSRKRMFCEDDVLQYYRQFSSFAAPIAHTRHLSEMQRDAAFWCGFHPTDRSTLQPALLAKYPYQPHDDPFPLYDVLSCARVAFAYHDPFPSWPQEEPFRPRSVRREQSVSEHVPPVTFGFRVLNRNDTSNDETTADPSELPAYSPDPRPSDFSSSFSTSEFRLASAHSEEDQHELEPTFDPSTPPSSFPLSTPSPMSDALPLAPSAADNDSKLTSLPSSLVSPTDFECSPSPMQRATDVQLEISPAPTSPDIQSSFPASPSDLESARSATDDQLEPVSLSSVTPPPPTPFHTPSLAPLAAEVPEIAPVSSAEPPANLAPLPSAFPVLPASSDLPSATLSPSLMLGELELESTPASTIVNSDTVPLSSPERPPSPINSTVLTPPGLLKLSPKGPITPPSPSPLEFTSRRSPEVMSIGSDSFSLEVTHSHHPSPRQRFLSFRNHKNFQWSMKSLWRSRLVSHHSHPLTFCLSRSSPSASRCSPPSIPLHYFSVPTYFSVWVATVLLVSKPRVQDSARK